MEHREFSAEWQVDHSYPTQLSEQLAENIRWSIATGRLRRGQRLPSLRDLAEHLSISMHTVRTSYKILERESLVVVRPRHGTLVIGHPDDDLMPHPVDRMMSRAISCGLAKGKTPDEIRRDFDSALSYHMSSQKNPRIAFVECTYTEARYLAQELASHLEIDVDPVVLSALEEEDLAQPPANERQWDALVTTFFHYGDVLEMARPYNISVFGLVVDSNLDQGNQLASLPDAPRIGVIAQTLESAQYLHNRVLGIAAGAQVRTATLDHSDAVADVVAWGDAFVVTLVCQETVEDLLGTDIKPVVCCHDQINLQSVQMLADHLAKRTPAQSGRLLQSVTGQE